MTASTPAPEAFAFAAALRSPVVRAQLAELGFNGEAGDVVVPVRDGEGFTEASARVGDDCRRALLVAVDDALPSGWSMDWASIDPHKEAP
ncbi:hypothetical protein [Actinoplanes sp. NPDC051494]|uniref:hypothetical protein n=1 Tax=Actinoplanes sp. NPDC051494 TaxID=3363907 RepID=UPI00378DA1BD